MRYTNYCVGDRKPPACPKRQKVGFPSLDDSRELYRIVRRQTGSAQTIFVLVIGSLQHTWEDERLI